MTPARRFAFRLALALGYANPDALLDSIPHRIFQEWQVYATYEPFGEERADLRAGIVASTIANAMARKKGRPAFKPKDFMPEFRSAAIRSSSPDRLFDRVKILNWMFGGKFEDKRVFSH